MNPISTRKPRSLATFLAALAFAALLPSVALGAVKKEGAWPDADKPITVDASGLSRSEAVRRVAEAAGWNVVVHAPAGDPVDVHVKNQPAGKVLDLVLNDAAYVARRDGTLIDIQREDAGATQAATDATAVAPVAVTPIVPAPPIVPATPVTDDVAVRDPTPPTPPTATTPSSKNGNDRVVTGGNLRIEKNEIVDDVTVMGGSLEVLGHVEGDVVVMGGSARILDGAHVEGDATAVGGTLDIKSGARVDGDVGVVGGVLNREPGSIIGGKTTHQGGDKGITFKGSDDPISSASSSPTGHDQPGWLAAKARDVGGALTRSAMLFLFGAVLLAVATRRMDSLRREAASRPARAIAFGVMGAIGSLVAAVILCITVIGIPVAVIGILVVCFGSYAGVCAVLTSAGEALTRHKTKNPYTHLFVGCLLFLVLGALPIIGGFVTAGVALAGIGVMFVTRGAGFVPPRGGRGSVPPRTGAATLV